MKKSFEEDWNFDLIEKKLEDQQIHLQLSKKINFNNDSSTEKMEEEQTVGLDLRQNMTIFIRACWCVTINGKSGLHYIQRATLKIVMLIETLWPEKTTAIQFQSFHIKLFHSHNINSRKI